MSALALQLGYAAAHRMAPGSPDLDDLAQEAALMVLSVQEARPASPVSYLSGVARMRIRNLLTHGKWTGSSDQRGHHRDPLLRKDTARLDHLEVDIEGPAKDFEDWASLAEVRVAVEGLPGHYRKIAEGVMAGDKPGQIAQDHGYTPGTVYTSWGEARARLRPQLSHLKELP